jgi:acetyl esterase
MSEPAPAVQAIIEQLEARFPSPDFASMTDDDAAAYIAQSRVNTSVATPGEAVAKTADLRIGPHDVPARVYIPEGLPSPAGVALYLHGGGWATGSIEMNDALCRALANRARVVVVASTSRLAPEHPFPAAADDAYEALRWVAAHAGDYGADPGRLAIVGSSAGGNLAASACLRARDENGPHVALQVLLYPVLDSGMTARSHKINGTGYFLTAAQMRFYWHKYVPDAEQRANPYASPMHADDVDGLPPTVVVTAEFDPLRDEGETFAHRLTAAHVPTKLYRANGQIHSFLSMLGVLPEADEFLDLVAAELRARIGDPSAS